MKRRELNIEDIIQVGYNQVRVVRDESRSSNLDTKERWIHGNSIVMAWFPIPSFDEILESNKDVLERIKEKGD